MTRSVRLLACATTALCLSCALAACPARHPPTSSATCGRRRSPSASARGLPRLRRTAFLSQLAATFRFRLGRPRSLTVTPDGAQVLFLRSGPRSFRHDLYEHDVDSGRERVLLSAATLLAGASETLSAEEKARRERMRRTARGIASYRLSRDGKRVLVPLSGRLYVVDRASAVPAGGASATAARPRVRELPRGGGYPIDARFSPDGRYVACVRGGQLMVIDVAAGTQKAVSPKPTPTRRYGVAEFVAQEEMRRYRGYWWSPDSKRLVFAEVDNSGVERRYVSQPARPLRAPRAFRYPRPGKANAKVRLGVVGVGGGTIRWLARDKALPYVATVRWQRRGPLLVVLQDRAQTRLRVMAVAGASRAGAPLSARVVVETLAGKVAPLIARSGRRSAFIELDQSVPRWVRVDGKRYLLWSAPHGDHRALVLVDERGDQRALALPKAPYRKLLHVDHGRALAYVAASRAVTERHVYALSLRSGRAAKLSKAAGQHYATIGRGGDVLVDSFEGPRGDRAVKLWRLRAPSAKNSLPVLAAAGALRVVTEKPRLAVHVQRLRVGERRLRALVLRPSALAARLAAGKAPAKRYPVIVYVYGGPHHQVVRALCSRYLVQQWLAEQGFVVVMLDGRGSPYRGRAFAQALRGNFVRVPLADQVAGLRALGRRLPELDLSRVGIYGWSFGGYLSAMAALLAPDVYKAAVAGAPVTEWRDYDSHYTERYLGLPAENAAGYRDSSALTHAAKLRRPLLLVHGTADDNVYFSHSLKLSRALLLAGRHHELLPLSGLTHIASKPLITRRLFGRIARFFQRHLGRPRPRSAK